MKKMLRTLVKKVKTGHNLGRAGTGCGGLRVQGYLEGKGGWAKEKYAGCVSMQVEK